MQIRIHRLTLAIIAIAAAGCGTAAAADDMEARRAALLAEIEADVRGGLGMPLDPRVRQAMATVPRHELSPPTNAYAYANQPLRSAMASPSPALHRRHHDRPDRSRMMWCWR